ncbi:sigma-70 family RNA polymerase sigma factor (plasmid) [Paenibacillus sp. S-38]|uniref:sigma-70 family RNA polymerase sigma factor n=1 Tax=Paenibacillus sp. S-38 TaxID=3416710 RepID=UPI003CF7A991
MSKHPDHIQSNLEINRDYYSLDDMSNIERAKVDSDYLGDVLVVNENLIWHSVHKYIGKPEKLTRQYCVEKDDIAQLGRLGFIKSIMAFDTTRGVKFSSFSVTAIVREIKCFLRDSAPVIRPTRTAHDLLNRISRLETEQGQNLSPEELSEALNKPIERIKKAQAIGRNVKYLHETAIHCYMREPDEPATSYLDLLEDGTDTEELAMDRSYVDSVVESIRHRLSEQEMRVLMLRISGLNQTQAAEQEGISQMRVGRIIKKVASLLLDARNSESCLDLDFTSVLENFRVAE